MEQNRNCHFCGREVSAVSPTFYTNENGEYACSDCGVGDSKTETPSVEKPQAAKKPQSKQKPVDQLPQFDFFPWQKALAEMSMEFAAIATTDVNIIEHASRDTLGDFLVFIDMTLQSAKAFYNEPDPQIRADAREKVRKIAVISTLYLASHPLPSGL